MTDSAAPEEVVRQAHLPEVPGALVARQWVDVAGAPRHDVTDPATQRVVARFAEAGGDVVAAAVESAHETWVGTWRPMAPARRGRILVGLAAALREHSEQLARLETVDTGKPISQARADVEVAARYLEYYGGAADKVEGTTIPQPDGTFAYTVREPYGVVAHVTPWNAPLSQMMRGVAPSLAAGNTVVVKPSEVTPLSTLLVARLLADAGLPAGACNVVPGPGGTTGDHLIRHELVRHITFTGSVATGRAVGRVAADRIVGCHLELGGKSPTIVLPDADLAAAARAGALAVIRNSGQSCFATTRLIVHRSVYEDFLDRLRGEVQGLSVGHGLDDPDLGPLASADQRDRVERHLAQARADGARVVAGGAPPAHLPDGYFYAPTVLGDVTNDMTVAREEVFGPVQSVLAFDELDEAVAMANDSPYGLSAGVFTTDLAIAHRVAAALAAGQVQVNRYAGAGVEIPFGGYKDSGLGREKGLAALAYYTQLKSVIVAIG